MAFEKQVSFCYPNTVTQYRFSNIYKQSADLEISPIDLSKKPCGQSFPSTAFPGLWAFDRNGTVNPPLLLAALSPETAL